MSDTAAASAATETDAASKHYGEGGALGKTGFAWAVFEWARNPYYILIVIYIFAPYFAREVMGADILASGELDGMDPETARRTANAGGQAAIASVTKWAGLVGAFTAPFLGAALDRGGRRKPILAIFLGTIALMSWLLWYAIPGESGFSTGTIMTFLVIAYVCYTYSEVTHNSMLAVAGAPQSLPGRERGRSECSGLGHISVGLRGFEPPTPGPPDQCANRTAPQPVLRNAMVATRHRRATSIRASGDHPGTSAGAEPRPEAQNSSRTPWTTRQPR